MRMRRISDIRSKPQDEDLVINIVDNAEQRLSEKNQQREKFKLSAFDYYESLGG